MPYLIAGNWKMNGTLASAEALAAELIATVRGAAAQAEVVLCPPAPLIPAVRAVTKGTAVAVGGQDCHTKEKGAHTGDVSPVLLAELGCRFVIVGHSERRADHGETDELVRAKAEAALKAGLTPIICVGETEAERERGETTTVIARQVTGSVPGGATAEKVVIAYEPVWAIGTGKTATTADIAAVHGQIATLFAAGRGGSDGLRILYGGSVKAANAKEILATNNVSGALVGGASLDAAEFSRIIESCPR
ncbi:MAG: triose-phosphate isomerase [Rhodospirillaceae bacterium]|nr:triose-phosphate isomerase [Rhodospirillaceae bacterium]